MLVRYQKVPKEQPILRPQARQHDPDYIRRLSESLVVQLQPIGLALDYSVIWGNARVLAARMNPAITHLDAVIFNEPITEREFQRMRFVENQIRQDLSNAEKCLNCVEYVKSEPSLTLKQIAADLGVDPSLVTRWMSWEKCVETVQRALADGVITLNEMYAIAQLPQEQQVAAVVDDIRRKGAPKKVKMSRVKCLMPSGVVVTLAGEGEGMTLDGVIETLVELLKSARKHKDEGLDAKTWERVLKSKAS